MMFNSYIPYRGVVRESGDVLRQNAGVDTAIGHLLNVDRALWAMKTGYTLFRYATTDIITKQFKLPPQVNQLSKLELYPTSNVKNGQTPLAAKIRPIQG